MVWTKAQPPRFIDERHVLQELRTLSLSRMKETEQGKRFIEAGPTVLKELELLQPIADLVKERCPRTAAGTQEALFDKAALELLTSKCVNRYWLWYLLSHLSTATFPMDALAIARAQARAKAALYDNRFGFGFVGDAGLIFELKQMPPGFVLELWDSGKIVCDPKGGSNGYPVLLNPILVDD